MGFASAPPQDDPASPAHAERLRTVLAELDGGDWQRAPRGLVLVAAVIATREVVAWLAFVKQGGAGEAWDALPDAAREAYLVTDQQKACLGQIG